MTISYGEKELSAVADRLSKSIKPGNIITFEGELAAGKTTLIKHICQSFGYMGNVNSPTFVIEHRYPSIYPGIKEIVHLDLYRLDKKAIDQLDWSEYSTTNTVTFIEWPGLAESNLPNNIKKVSIEKLSAPTERKLTLSENFND